MTERGFGSAAQRFWEGPPTRGHQRPTNLLKVTWQAVCQATQEPRNQGFVWVSVVCNVACLASMASCGRLLSQSRAAWRPGSYMALQ